MTVKELSKQIAKKTELINSISEHISNTFHILKECSQEVIEAINEEHKSINSVFEDNGEYEFKISFGEDTLIFMRHTNIFEFSRFSEVMKLPYIQNHKEYSFCGIINIYNFLSDSILYQRELDLGYLIGRIFINRNGNFFIEGKQELGFPFIHFNKSVVNKKNLNQIIISAMSYVNNFDLLTPPFDEMKEISVVEINANSLTKKVVTAKRLGFQFNKDDVKEGVKA